MKTNTIESEATDQTLPAASEKQATAKTAGRSAKKASNKASKGNKPKKVARSAEKAKHKEAGARGGSKSSKVLELLRRPDGATLPEIMKATGWQAHSVRGFISGSVGKKMGLTIQSSKNDAGERFYKVTR